MKVDLMEFAFVFNNEDSDSSDNSSDGDLCTPDLDSSFDREFYTTCPVCSFTWDGNAQHFCNYEYSPLPVLYKDPEWAVERELVESLQPTYDWSSNYNTDFAAHIIGADCFHSPVSLQWGVKLLQNLIIQPQTQALLRSLNLTQPAALLDLHVETPNCWRYNIGVMHTETGCL